MECYVPKIPRLVLIEWEDSGQPVPQWQWLDDVQVTSAIRCQTVGFLIQDDRAVKVIAQNVGDIQGDARQVSGVIRIPTRAVTRVIALTASKASKAASGRGPALPPMHRAI